jgi:uncharacterized membrane-anchored protein YhcB (DUF1043 family)
MYRSSKNKRHSSRGRSKRHYQEENEKEQQHSNVKNTTSPPASITPSMASYSSSISYSKEGILIQRLQNTKQQQLNTQEHIFSLREEVQRQRQRMEHSLHSTFQLLKSELERYLQESLENLNHVEHSLLTPLNEQANLVGKNMASIQHLVDNMNHPTSDREYYIQQSHKLLVSDASDQHVTVPDFGQLTNRHNFTICNVSLNYEPTMRFTTRSDYHNDSNIAVKETDEQEQRDMMAQFNGLDTNAKPKQAYDTSSSEGESDDESDVSSIFSTSGYESDSSATSDASSAVSELFVDQRRKYSKQTKPKRSYYPDHRPPSRQSSRYVGRSNGTSSAPPTARISNINSKKFHSNTTAPTTNSNNNKNYPVSDAFIELQNLYQSAKKNNRL